MLESLEPRQLFSGVVTVTSDYGPDHRLLIQGDAASNEIVLTASYAYNDSLPLGEDEPYDLLEVYNGRLIVNGVEISGGGADGYAAISSKGRDSRFYSFLNQPPLIDLGGGDDAVRLESDLGNYFGDALISTGRGNDRITGDGVFTGLHIGSGAGDDRVTVTSDYNSLDSINGIDGNLDIETGAGNDRITLLGGDNTLRVHGQLRVTDNSGRTQVNIAAVRAFRTASISTGNAADVINVANSRFRGETTFITRGGDDVVRFRGKVTVPSIATALQFGSGRDTFDADRYYEDFVG